MTVRTASTALQLELLLPRKLVHFFAPSQEKRTICLNNFNVLRSLGKHFEFIALSLAQIVKKPIETILTFSQGGKWHGEP